MFCAGPDKKSFKIYNVCFTSNSSIFAFNFLACVTSLQCVQENRGKEPPELYMENEIQATIYEIMPAWLHGKQFVGGFSGLLARFSIIRPIPRVK